MTAPGETIVLTSDDPELLRSRVASHVSRRGDVRAEVDLEFPLVVVRMWARRGRGEALLGRAADDVCSRFARALVSRRGLDPAAELLARLESLHLKLAVAESCTGGLVSHGLTSVAGASAVLTLGVVAYADEAKRRVLGVPAATLERHGAVSAATAHAMLTGALAVSGADCGLVSTGIAGPTGATPRKPVGLVFLGAARGSRRAVVRRVYPARSRERFAQIAGAAVMHLLLRMLGDGRKAP